MSLWYLDNEYTTYVILADSEANAWKKLLDQFGIMPYGSEDDGDDPELSVAYHPMWRVAKSVQVDNSNDIQFVL